MNSFETGFIGLDYCAIFSNLRLMRIENAVHKNTLFLDFNGFRRGGFQNLYCDKMLVFMCA